MDNQDSIKKTILEAILNQDVGRLSTLNLSRYDDLPIQFRPFDKHVTAFEVASNHGYHECIKKLVKEGIDLFNLNTTYKRALLRASLGRHMECVYVLSQHALFDRKTMEECEGLEEIIGTVVKRDFSRVQDLLERNVGQNWIRSTEGQGLMNLLIFYNCSVDILQRLFGHGVSINGHDRHGFTPLMSAVIAGSTEITHFLLQKGVDKNLCDKRDASLNGGDDNLKENLKWDVVDGELKTALMYAVNVNKFECIDLLLKSSDVNKVDEGGLTALMHAAYVGNSKTARQILGCLQKTDVDIVDKKSRSALIHAAYSGDITCVEVFLRAQANQQTKDCCKRTAFMAAVISKDSKCVERLLTPQENLDVEDTKGKTSIMYAAESGNFELLEMLLKTLKSQPATGSTKQKDRIADHMKRALFSAVKAGALPCVDLLVRKKCKVNCFDFDGETPLMHACQSGNMECFNFLVKHGADVKAVSKSSGNSMIMYAVNGDLQCLDFLLKKKAKVNFQNNNGETALMLACAVGRKDCCDSLQKSGAKVDVVNRLKQTALMYAAKKGYVDCFSSLLDSKADIRVKDVYEHTVVYYAFSHQECCESLMQKRGKEFLSDDVHAASFSHSDVKSVPIQIVTALLEKKILRWSELYQDPIKLFFSAIMAGLSPHCLSTLFEGRVFSLPRTFFGGDSKVVRYILANLFFTREDYMTIMSDAAFKRSLRERGDSDMVLIFEQLISQPCSLQTLCLFNISTYISSSSVRKPRVELVNSLSISDNFKTLLKFQGPLSNLCPSDWAAIGNPPSHIERQSLLSSTVKKPLWPYLDQLCPCDKKMCICSGKGLAVVTPKNYLSRP